MIWHPARDWCLSNIFCGWESPSIGQWKTVVSVTMAIVLTLIHFQNKTSSFMVWAFIFDFISMLKIWSVLIALKAMTFDVGFMIALSAEIGLRIGVWALAISMMTTWAASPTFSRTQMNLSDSIVRLLKLMLVGWIPTAVNCQWEHCGQVNWNSERWMVKRKGHRHRDERMRTENAHNTSWEIHHLFSLSGYPFVTQHLPEDAPETWSVIVQPWLTMDGQKISKGDNDTVGKKRQRETKRQRRVDT